MLEILCWDCSPFQWNLWKWNPVSHSLCHPFPSWFQHRAKFGSNNPHQLLTVWSVGLPYRYDLGDCPLLPPTDAEYNLYQGFPNCNVPYNNLGVLVKMQMCIQLFSHRAQDSDTHAAGPQTTFYDGSSWCSMSSCLEHSHHILWHNKDNNDHGF